MAGQPYNLGLDSANLSKEELAARREEVRSELLPPLRADRRRPGQAELHRLERAAPVGRLRARRSLDDGIRELIKGYRMEARGPFKNAA